MKTALLFGVITSAVLGATAQVQEIAFKADSAVLSEPFKLTHGYIAQPVTTNLANGGRAVFAFNLTNAGSYVIRATVNAQSAQTHSIAINLDAEPKEPDMIWEVAATSGFEAHLVSWRGHATSTNPHLNAQVFTLAPGPHQLIVRGIDANTQLQQVSILQLPAAPTGLHVVAGP